KLYDGIFSYALIHLLDKNEREKFIRDCHNQLKPGGSMLFSFISKNDPMYGSGRELSKDRFEMTSGVNLFFYDSDSIRQEFGNYGLPDFSEIDEPVKFMPHHPPMKFTIVKCKKTDIFTDINTDKLTKTELEFLEQIAAYLDRNGEISNYRARLLTGKSDNSVKKYFAKFVNTGILKMEGEKKGRKYLINRK
ncbi:MAG: class I SAM-dependent methyltransferase, partial [Prevotellaceae bacterium]|nr:class I SAM-dependent methyltransferase [Prevotellaceae bacterium]